MSAIPSLPEKRTLNGKFDARCHICWNLVYILWVADEDPAGKCPHGHTKATDCTDAMAAARNSASMIKYFRDLERT